MVKSLVPNEWIQEQAHDVPLGRFELGEEEAEKLHQLLALFGEYVLIQAEQEYNRRIVEVREQAQEIPY